MAQACIDMQVQNHINTLDGTNWYRCKRVEFAGGTATWELKRTGLYSFSEAYQMTPHRQLIRATDDDSLRVFVKAWGPLRPVLDDWSGSDPIETYRKVRDRMTTLVRLLGTAGDQKAQRSALLELTKYAPNNEGVRWDAGFAAVHRSAQPEKGTKLSGWLETATPKQLEVAATRFISTVAAPFFASKFTAERRGSDYVLKDLLNFKSVVHTLYWMVWQDVYRERQFQFCVECGKLIPSTTRHAKRFCPDGCAHRRTAREWQQRKRAKEREIDGTKKTR
jgi:hypothetical protein